MEGSAECLLLVRRLGRPKNCSSQVVKEKVNVAIVIATIGGLLGLAGSAAATSDRSVTAEVPIRISSPELQSLFLDNLEDQILAYENSHGESEDDDYHPSVSSESLSLRGPSGSETALLRLGDRLWGESRAATLSQAKEVLMIYQSATTELCPHPRCQVQLNLAEIQELSAMSKASEHVPETLPDSLAFNFVGSGPSSAVVLAVGTGAGAALGGLSGWFIANLFRRNRD